MTDQTNPDQSPRLIVPALAPFYRATGPLAEALLRVIAGFALMAHGWPKIQAPMGAAGMVEGLGFAPGWLWAPALATTEFFGGLLILLGLFTRPAAFAASIVLAVTIYAHWVVFGQGYSGAELSLIWTGVTLYFAANGGGRYSLDRLIGRQF